MPIFEYQCQDCSGRFEQLVYGKETEVRCRTCGSHRVQQLLSTFAVAAAPDKASRELGPCGSCGAAQRGMCGVE